MGFLFAIVARYPGGEVGADGAVALTASAEEHTHIFVGATPTGSRGARHAAGERGRAWQAVRRDCRGSATEPGTLAYLHVSLALQRAAAALSLDVGGMAHAREWLQAHDRWLVWTGCVLWRSEGQTLWAQYHRRAAMREGMGARRTRPR